MIYSWFSEKLKSKSDLKREKVLSAWALGNLSFIVDSRLFVDFVETDSKFVKTLPHHNHLM